MEIVQSVQQAVKIPQKGVQRAKRAATESGIIDAFERLLVRDGASGLGVNALVKEAGIGKRQLYAYFGGLAGVATQWIVRCNVWPTLDQMRGEDITTFARKPAAEKIRIVNRNYAEVLRCNPPLCELLTGEFTRSVELKEAIESDPQFADAYLALGHALHKLGRFPEAVDSIGKAIALNGHEALYHTSLSTVYRDMGRISDAEEEMAISFELQRGR